ncbi:MAG TPA: hypothetical protein VIW68_06540 [Candidatus Sulfotelmatobacter sp.]
MKREGVVRRRFFRAAFSCAIFSCALVGITGLTVLVERGEAQGGGYERSFGESKASVEKVLKDLPFALAGRLPVLDGFAVPGDHSLDSYQRGYFQSTVQVKEAASGGSVVRVTTKVTAWYSDPIASRSGYRLLPSNGRLEGDLLDELAAELGKRAASREGASRGDTANVASASEPASAPSSTVPASVPAAGASSPSPSISAGSAPAGPVTQAQIAQQITQPKINQRQIDEGRPADPSPAAPTPRLPETGGTFSASVARGLAAQPASGAATVPAPPPDAELKAEAESLQEILKNQSHPNNLVAVKKSGTPVVDSPSLKAKTLFLASEHDEFEMLDFNADWVHVRISGLSRGWVWRNSLEMPSGIPDVETIASAEPSAADLFHVVREETSLFPGDWGALQGKSVKIFSVQMIDEKAKGSTVQAKLEFAKSLLGQSYADLAKDSPSLGGAVLVFDSADGGMLAVPLPVLQRWKAGKLTDAALWHQSFFDPPETFGGSAGTSASQ